MRNSIQIQETANGILVTVPTLHHHHEGLPFSPRALGEMIQGIKGEGDSVLEEALRESKDLERRTTFDRYSAMVPGCYQFTNVNKALEFIRLLLTGECETCEDALNKVTNPKP